MEVDSYENGRPSWVDLGVPDPRKAARFYSALFAWDVQEGPPESGGYAIAHLRGKAVAGLGPQQNFGPPAWMTYVNVDSADGTAAKFKANGGTVFMEPFDVMDVGRMGVFADPAGAVISVWQPGVHKGAGIVNEPGTFSWNELITNDLDGAKAFYGAVFGWGAETHGEGPDAYTEWTLGGRSIAGMMPKPPTMPDEMPPHWGVYFAVADTDEAVKRVVELGGSVMVAPMDIEPGRFAVVADPTNAAFNLLAMREGAAG
jgi:predicted enzyme related to lactoylglutathione lyase